MFVYTGSVPGEVTNESKARLHIDEMLLPRPESVKLVTRDSRLPHDDVTLVSVFCQSPPPLEGVSCAPCVLLRGVNALGAKLGLVEGAKSRSE